MAHFRYLVENVDEAISFYRDLLGFDLKQQFGPAMAILQRADLELWLAGPMASASKPMADGTGPKPGGWNRFVLIVPDLERLVTELRQNEIPFLNDIVTGPGGKQILCRDPSGNVVELFEAA